MMNNQKINVSMAQAMQMAQREDVVLVDVKSPEEYQNHHLKNSINIPIEVFPQIAPKVLKNKKQTIILYCSSGIRSLAALEILREWGYRHVYHIKLGEENAGSSNR